TIDCASTTCTGVVHTSSGAFGGTVAADKARTSTGTASCTAGGGTCQVEATSVASTGPGVTQELAGDTAVNVKRLVAAPSAASAAGGVLNCSSDVPCTGKVTSAANGADPAISTGVRGSSSTGVCQGVTGGVCQA